MASLVERIGALAGTEMSDVVDLVYTTYQDRLTQHRHVGRALVETAAALCRRHPRLVGLGAGVLVEQILVRAKDPYGADENGGAAGAAAAPIDPFTRVQEASASAKPIVGSERTPLLGLSELRPGQIASEVFGALLLLKLASTGAKFFRHKHQDEVWFAPAARIRLFSASLAVYNLVAAARGSRASAWRNGAILFFGTDALKPLLNPSRKQRRLAARDRALRRAAAPAKG